jgi:hypothetical protein
MYARPAPTYENGLALYPRKRDCVGENCPVRERVGRCFIDRHHLYFSAFLYENAGDAYRKLRDDPNASVSMARCRHNSLYPNAWHRKYDYTPLPSRDIVYRFLDESRLLTRMGVTVEYMGKDLNLLDVEDDSRKVIRLRDDGVREKRIERFMANHEIFNRCIAQVTELEVIPAPIIGRALTELGRRRNELVDRASLLIYA